MENKKNNVKINKDDLFPLLDLLTKYDSLYGDYIFVFKCGRKVIENMINNDDFKI